MTEPNAKPDLEKLEQVCPDCPGLIKILKEIQVVMKHFNTVIDQEKVMATEVRLTFKEALAIVTRLLALAAENEELKAQLEEFDPENIARGNQAVFDQGRQQGYQEGQNDAQMDFNRR